MFYLLLVAATLIIIVLVEMSVEIVRYRKAAKDAEDASDAALERARHVLHQIEDNE